MSPIAALIFATVMDLPPSVPVGETPTYGEGGTFIWSASRPFLSHRKYLTPGWRNIILLGVDHTPPRPSRQEGYKNERREK